MVWVYPTIFFLQKLVDSMGSLIDRKSWKISINCHENDTIFKSFYVWVVLELFGFFFYFMSIVIIKNVIALFECKWFMPKQFCTLRNTPLREEMEKSLGATRKTDLSGKTNEK